MPNIVNEILLDQLEKDIKDAGSCLVLSFDRLTVLEVSDLRTQLRDSGVDYHVVKNRLAVKAFKSSLDLDMVSAFQGKCGIVTAPDEGAIGAAKIVREAGKKQQAPKVSVTGAVIEGEAILGAEAACVANMPDRDTIHAQLAIAISGPSRGIAVAMQALGAGLARVIQAKLDEETG